MWFYLLYFVVGAIAVEFDFSFKDIGEEGNPFSVINEKGYSEPSLAFGDLDDDGDFDLVVGDADGIIHFFRNTGDSSSPVFELEEPNPLPLSGSILKVANNAHPYLVDIDDNGTLDMFVGTEDNGIRFFLNSGTVSDPEFQERSELNPLSGDLVDEFCCDVRAYFYDWDKDGDLDAFVSERNYYFQNTRSASYPEFEKLVDTDVNNPLQYSPFKLDRMLGIWDQNGDGNPDIFIAHENGFISFRAGFGTSPRTILGGNPLYAWRTGIRTSGTHVDLDGDGDQDIIITHSDGISYLENIRDNGWKVEYIEDFELTNDNWVGPVVDGSATFESGTMEGWTMVKQDDNGQLIHVLYNEDDLTVTTANHVIGPTPVSFRDNDNTPMIVRSQEFTIPESPPAITFKLAGGSGLLSTAGANEYLIDAGFLGVGLRSVETGEYIMFKNLAYDSPDAFEKVWFTAAALTFHIGKVCTLDLIDYHKASVPITIGSYERGGVGWILIDDVELPEGQKTIPTSECGDYGTLLGGAYRLGRNDFASKVITVSQTHTLVRIMFDLILIDAWNQEKFYVSVLNVDTGEYDIVYEKRFPLMSGYQNIFWELTGYCGYNGVVSESLDDFIVPVSVFAAHSTSELTVRFQSLLANSELVASFGVDNVIIESINSPPPVVTGISTDDLSVHGSDILTIYGTDFDPSFDNSIDGLTSSLVVSVNGQNCLSSTWVSTTEITCVTPPGVGENLDVIVLLYGQKSTGGEGLFTYTKPVVSSISPDVASIGGGDTVTMTGYNFGDPAKLTGYVVPVVHRVFLGLFECLNVVWNSDTEITCTLPTDGFGYLQGVVVQINDIRSDANPIFTFSPRLDSGIILNEDPGTSSTSITGTSTEGGDLLTFSGEGLGDADHVVITYGPKTQPTRYKCTTIAGKCDNNKITCSTEAGIGIDFNFLISIQGYEILTDDTFSYPPPTVISVTGCVGSVDLGTINGSPSVGATLCERDSEPTVTVTGLNFGIHFQNHPPIVSFGDLESTTVVQDAITPHRKLIVTLPKGRGINLNVIVTNMADVSSTPLVNGLSYAPCAAGSFEPDDTSHICTLCPKGSASTVDGTLYACPLCDQGYYANIEGMNACLPCDEGEQAPSKGSETCEKCPAGSATNSKGTPTCASCSAGWYAEEGWPLCKTCPDGSISALDHSGSCTECSAGTYAQDRTACVICPLGKMSNDGEITCHFCPLGEYANEHKTCDECDAGFYKDDTTTQLCSPCPPGEFTSSTGQSTCSQCDPGHVSEYGSDTCTACSPGSYSPDRKECIACDPGSIAATEGLDTCSPCDAGYQSIDSIRCEACGLGSYSSAPNSEECTRCDADWYAAAVGSTICEKCPDAAIANYDQSSCDCAQGYYSVATGVMVDCIICPSGGNCQVSGITFDNIESLPGYWQEKEHFVDRRDELYFHQCRRTAYAENMAEEAERIDGCGGGNSLLDGTICKEGHIGRLCDHCESSYYKNTSEICEECPGAGKAFFYFCLSFGAPIGIVFGISLIYRWMNRLFAKFVDFKKNQSDREWKFLSDRILTPPLSLSDMNVIDVAMKLRILLSFVQVISQYEEIFSVVWPSGFLSILRYVALVNMDPLLFPPVACTLSTYSAFIRLFVCAILPASICAIGGLTCKIRKFWKRSRSAAVYGVQEWELVERNLIQYDQLEVKVWKWCFNIVMVTLPGAAAAIVRTFTCMDAADGESYLYTDLEMQCGSFEHIVLCVLALMAGSVYGFIFKRFLEHLAVVREHSEQIHKEKSSKAVSIIASDDILMTARTARIPDSAKKALLGVDEMSTGEDTDSEGLPLTTNSRGRNPTTSRFSTGITSRSTARNTTRMSARPSARNSARTSARNSARSTGRPGTAQSIGSVTSRGSVESAASALPKGQGFCTLYELAERHCGFWLHGHRPGIFTYWEVVDMVRKIFMCGIMFCLLPGSSAQLVFASTVALLSLAIVVTVRPYQHQCDMAVQTAAHSVIFFTLIFGLMLKFGILSEGHFSVEMIDGVLIGATATPVILCLIIVAYQRLGPLWSDRIRMNATRPTHPISIKKYLKMLEQREFSDGAAIIAADRNPPAHNLLEQNCEALLILEQRHQLHTQLVESVRELLFEIATFRSIFYDDKLKFKDDPDAVGDHTAVVRVLTVVVQQLETFGLPLTPADPPSAEALDCVDRNLTSLERHFGIDHVEAEEREAKAAAEKKNKKKAKKIARIKRKQAEKEAKEKLRNETGSTLSGDAMSKLADGLVTGGREGGSTAGTSRAPVGHGLSSRPPMTPAGGGTNGGLSTRVSSRVSSKGQQTYQRLIDRVASRSGRIDPSTGSTSIAMNTNRGGILLNKASSRVHQSNTDNTTSNNTFRNSRRPSAAQDTDRSAGIFDTHRPFGTETNSSAVLPSQRSVFATRRGGSTNTDDLSRGGLSQRILRPLSQTHYTALRDQPLRNYGGEASTIPLSITKGPEVDNDLLKTIYKHLKGSGFHDTADMLVDETGAEISSSSDDGEADKPAEWIYNQSIPRSSVLRSKLVTEQDKLIRRNLIKNRRGDSTIEEETGSVGSTMEEEGIDSARSEQSVVSQMIGKDLPSMDEMVAEAVKEREEAAETQAKENTLIRRFVSPKPVTKETIIDHPLFFAVRLLACIKQLIKRIQRINFYLKKLVNAKELPFLQNDDNEKEGDSKKTGKDAKKEAKITKAELKQRQAEVQKVTENDIRKYNLLRDKVVEGMEKNKLEEDEEIENTNDNNNDDDDEEDGTEYEEFENEDEYSENEIQNPSSTADEMISPLNSPSKKDNTSRSIIKSISSKLSPKKGSKGYFSETDNDASVTDENSIVPITPKTPSKIGSSSKSGKNGKTSTKKKTKKPTRKGVDKTAASNNASGILLQSSRGRKTNKDSRL